MLNRKDLFINPKIIFISQIIIRAYFMMLEYNISNTILQNVRHNMWHIIRLHDLIF